MVYQMARMPVTLSELEGYFCCYDRQNVSSRSICNSRAPWNKSNKSERWINLWQMHTNCTILH